MPRPPGPCVRELEHRFDAVSGWCANGCGWRSDGRSQYRNLRPVITARDITEPLHSHEEA